jgi:hypothetical protein
MRIPAPLARRGSLRRRSLDDEAILANAHLAGYQHSLTAAAAEVVVTSITHARLSCAA